MKKTVATMAVFGATFCGWSQGTVVFENSLGTGNVFWEGDIFNGQLVLPGTYDVALLYSRYTSGIIPQSSFTQVAF